MINSYLQFVRALFDTVTSKREIEANSETVSETVEELKKKLEHQKARLYLIKFSWARLTVAMVFGALVGFGICLFVYNKINLEIGAQILLSSTGAAALYAYMTFISRMGVEQGIRKIELQLVRAGAVELQDNIDENFFTNLVRINFKYLDQYYLQTQEQAGKSFQLSSFAAKAGLLVVITGVVMMFLDKTSPGYVTAGAGVLSEFIAAVFFYLYNKTILKMSEYHQKLVITQNISLALRITDDMDAELKAKSLSMLIDRLTTDVNKYLSGAWNEVSK